MWREQKGFRYITAFGFISVPVNLNGITTTLIQNDDRGKAERYFFNIELQTYDLVNLMTDNIKIEELD
jgi:hypothetical protein